MTNVLLGKVMKAMYKLSGKTIAELADETGLTIDTINNIFYARLQKPGLNHVADLSEACGFSMTELYRFSEIAKAFPEETDITTEFTKFVMKKKEDNAILLKVDAGTDSSLVKIHPEDNGMDSEITIRIVVEVAK